MACYIIADLHLSESSTELNLAFEAFVKRLRSGDKLFIAGDLFDFFVGIDLSDRAQLVVRRSIKEAKAAGVSVLFTPGNRDFLIRKSEAQYFGFELLPEFHVIKAPYGDVLLTHGDALCTNDLKYQKFKRRCRNPALQQLFLLLPLSLRRKIGRNIRAKSANAAYLRVRNQKLYGAVPATIEKLLSTFKCSNLVHGHFHIFERRYRECRSEKARLSLGAWGDTYSYVRMDGNGLAHVQKPLTDLIDKSF